MKKTIITTCDLHEEYEVLGPVYFQISNHRIGLNNSKYDEYVAKYHDIFKKNKEEETKVDLIDLMFSPVLKLSDPGSHSFKVAFYIACEELKSQAESMGGDAVIGMKQDIDIDSTGFQYFYLQMYGTAVKRKKTLEEIEEERLLQEEEKRKEKEKEDELRNQYNCDSNHDFKIPMKPIECEYEIKCPVCKTMQRKDRTRCWNCGQVFSDE